MIRFLLILPVFLGGLGAAGLWLGQMHHLRLALPDGLPGWTDGVTDRSGARQGEMLLPAEGPRPELRLDWTARGLGAEGALWDLRLSGEGVEIGAEMVLPWWPDRVLLRDGRGTVALAGRAEGLAGIVALTGLTAELHGSSPGDLSGTMTAEARGIALGDAALGAGPVTGRIAAGQWALEGALSGGLSPGTAQATGDLAARSGELVLVVEDAAALPAQARRALGALGQEEGAALRVELPLFW
jgi:hypothetical protein